jgi:hypothetical protein
MTTEEYRDAFRCLNVFGLYHCIGPCTDEVRTVSSDTALVSTQVKNIPAIPSTVKATEYVLDNTHIRILIVHKV